LADNLIVLRVCVFVECWAVNVGHLVSGHGVSIVHAAAPVFSFTAAAAAAALVAVCLLVSLWCTAVTP
jgi:hypothetical protein